MPEGHFSLLDFFKPKTESGSDSKTETKAKSSKELFSEQEKALFQIIDQVFQNHYSEQETKPESARQRFKSLVKGALLGLPPKIGNLFYNRTARRYLKLVRDATDNPENFTQQELETIQKITQVTSELKIDFLYLSTPSLIRGEISAIRGPIEVLQFFQKLRYQEREKVEDAILGKQLNEIISYAQGEIRNVSNKRIIEALLQAPNFSTENKVGSLVQILDQPFKEKRSDLVQMLNTTTRGPARYLPKNIPENAHPLRIIEITDKVVPYLEQNQAQSKLLSSILEYRQLVWDHTVISSLINLQTAPWRRYAKLNLDAIKTEANPRILNAVAFDETREISLKNDPANDNLEESITNAFSQTLEYGFHNWVIDPEGSLLNRLMSKYSEEKPFSSYNRSSREEEVLLPQKGRVILKQTAWGGYQIINIDSLHQATTPLAEQHLTQLYDLIIQGKTLKTTFQLAKALPVFAEVPEQELAQTIRDLASLPILILDLENNQDKEVLTPETVYEVNKRRSQFPNANYVMLARRAKDKLCLSMSTNHDVGDGNQASQLLKDTLGRLVDLNHTKDHLMPAPNPGVFPSLEKLETKESYFPVQLNVEGTKFFLMVNEVAAYARELKKQGKLSPKSFLSSPAFIMQLALIDSYRDMLGLKRHEIVGVLLGDLRIDSDLDLARTSNGFNLKKWAGLDDNKKTTLLQILEQQFDNALKQSNIQRLVRGVVSTLPKSWHQPLNTLSEIFSEALKNLQGSMISAFSLPRFRTDGTAISPREILHNQSAYGNRASGPALTPNQESAITICSTHSSLDQENKLAKMVLSIRIKNRDNSKAYETAQKVAEFIQSFER